MESFRVLFEGQYATVKSKRPFIVARSSPSTVAVRGVGVCAKAIADLKDWPQRRLVLMHNSVRLTGSFFQSAIFNLFIGCLRVLRKHYSSPSRQGYYFLAAWGRKRKLFVENSEHHQPTTLNSTELCPVIHQLYGHRIIIDNTEKKTNQQLSRETLFHRCTAFDKPPQR
jgi:hypothetical protein